MTGVEFGGDELVSSSDVDVSGYLRRARRLGDLSQRDLSAAVGVDQATIARIEGGADVTVLTFARLLAAGGLRLAVVDKEGLPVEPMPGDVYRDRSGRRLPAHLDVHAPPELPTMKMLMRACDPIDGAASWHHRRPERDRLRRERGTQAGTEQLTVSTPRGAPRARR